MNVDAATVGKQLVELNSHLIEPLQIAADSLTPRIAVSFDLDHRWLFGERLSRNVDAPGEVLPCCEWRIDVNQADLPGKVAKQGWQDVLLVAPDQAVSPL